MMFDIEKAINKRHSVRNYSNKNISDEILNKIKKYINSLDMPMGVRIEFIFDDNIGKYKGTYGFVKGAKNYMALICEENIKTLLWAGFIFEHVILYCTSIDIGTVWLGGTFNKNIFNNRFDLKHNESIKILVPFGYENNDKKGVLNNILSKNSSKRNDFEKMFFKYDFNSPITYSEYKEIYEFVRKSPSSLNSQPWRVLECDDFIHFYSNKKNTEFSEIDMGIGLCHFYLGAKFKNKEGMFVEENPNIDTPYNYIISWKILKKQY